MQRLETRMPPPILCALVAVCMWAGAQGTAALAPAHGLRLGLAVLTGFVGLCFAAPAFREFGRASTTVDPTRPQSASALVTTGIYGLTRNPMYVSLTALLLAWAVWLGAAMALLGPVTFALFLTRFQIMPEERALQAKFGDSYTAYRQRVRRWL